MKAPSSSDPAAKALDLRVAVAIVILLWLAYAVLQTLVTMGYVSEGPSALLSFLPGILAVAVLLAAGLPRGASFLRLAPLSRKGIAVLAVVFVFALASIVPAGVWRGWDWRAALVYAPASGISQELFFRAALLPAVMAIMPKRACLSLLVHALLFSLWHIGPLFVGAPIWAVLAVLLVPFLCGLGWGWQVRHDGTVVWAMLQHSLIWVIGLQFAFSA
jgi:membrane protease YdiL (CAAX protease family)